MEIKYFWKIVVIIVKVIDFGCPRIFESIEFISILKIKLKHCVIEILKPLFHRFLVSIQKNQIYHKSCKIKYATT